MKNCIAFERIEKSFRSGFGLRIPHLALPAGARVGLVGNNGAGKTTLLLIALGLLPPDTGRVFVLGADIRRERGWRSATASFMGDASLLSFLTPREYWTFVGSAYRLRSRQVDRRIEAFRDFVDVEPTSRKLIREHSTGTRKKIGLVAAMMVRPSLLILDEPFTSLDPKSHGMLSEHLEALNRDYGTALVIASHDLVHVVGLCSRIAVIENGYIVHDGASGSDTLDQVRQILTRGASSPIAG